MKSWATHRNVICAMIVSSIPKTCKHPMLTPQYSSQSFNLECYLMLWLPKSCELLNRAFAISNTRTMLKLSHFKNKVGIFPRKIE